MLSYHQARNVASLTTLLLTAPASVPTTESPTKTDYGPGWHDLRLRVMARDGFRCQWPGCGRHKKLTVHHKLSRAAGGPDAMSNLITLCKACHRAVHLFVIVPKLAMRQIS
jgi:hypothetical protein